MCELLGEWFIDNVGIDVTYSVDESKKCRSN